MLNHCWGPVEFLTLTVDNEPRLRQKFSVSEMPKNFQDAVKTTRALGFQFIWIDSLCILQGEGGDWASQSLLMDKVYGNAEICLAAAASKDAEGGLFRRRDPNKFQSITINLLFANGKASDQLPALTEFCAYVKDDMLSLWKNAVNESPLNLRPWVLQERLLSRRTIYFTEEQLCWECKELRSFELVPNDGLRKSNRSGPWWYQDIGPNTSFNFKDWEPESCEFDETSALRMYWNWECIVSAYTRCDALTKETDKLVAVSGVAKAFSKYMGCEYYAGLWDRFLLLDLLWYVKEKPQRPQSYRAPSWSWASFDGEIRWPLLHRFFGKGKPYWQALAELGSVKMETGPDSNDAMGAVKPGTHLVLFGCLVPCYHEGKDLRRFAHVSCVRDDKETSDNENGQAYLLPLIKEAAIRGLLLEKVEGMAINNRACYRRLGTFETDLEDRLHIIDLFGSLDGWLGRYEKAEVTII